MGIIKNRCVCEICSCGKHQCGPEHNKLKSVGRLDLKNQGDIYVASKASFNYPDTLNLFEGLQSHTSIVKGDYKGHDKVGVERHKPTDQIRISREKMEHLTENCREYPAYDIGFLVKSDRAKTLPAAPISTEYLKMKGSTSYGDHFTGKSVSKIVPRIHSEELVGPKDDLDLTTINKADYIAFEYGRPHLNTIPDNNVFGVSEHDKVSKDTTSKEHFPEFKSAPATKIVGEKSSLEFGSDPRVIASVYGGDYLKFQPKVRKSKRRGSKIDFGREVDHKTSYSTQFEGKDGGRLAAAKFDDQLKLFCGDQDLQTIVRADYKPHLKVGVERHRPKDLIEIPHDKMTLDTVTLGHYQAPTVAVKESAGLHAIPDIADSKRVFDITQAIPNYKMETETSYRQQYPAKKASTTIKASFKNEILPSSGKLDLSTVHKTDYLKFNYGRPMINKIEDNNVFGINYSIGRCSGARKPSTAGSSGLKEEDIDDHSDVAGIRVSRGSVRSVKGAMDMEVESVPSSRGSLRVDVGDVNQVESAPHPEPAPIIRDIGRSATICLGEPIISTYGKDFKLGTGRMRSTKKKDASINFGSDFYADTSYRNQFTTKQCIVPSLDKLDEYTFKAIKHGHRVYKVDCGCPPRGACGCPPIGA